MIELVKEIRKKNKAAITTLYNRYGKKLYGFAIYKWNLDEDEAWEIVYQTLYKIIEVSDKYVFADEKKFVGFIYKVFVNNLRNYYQKKKSKHEVILRCMELQLSVHELYETFTSKPRTDELEAG